MTQEDLQETVGHRPFEPFRLVLTTGDKYEVRHPELIMVGRRSAIIGLNEDPTRTYYQRTIQVDLMHIVAIERLPSVGNSSNGSAA